MGQNGGMNPPAAPPRVTVQTEDFDLGAETLALRAGDGGIGAVVSFVGTVRDGADGSPVSLMELEHYPGMTEASIEAMIDEAFRRFDIRGRGSSTASARCGRASRSCWCWSLRGIAGRPSRPASSLMDYLKTQAPFWKKEHGPDGARWVDARVADDEALARWGIEVEGNGR